MTKKPKAMRVADRSAVSNPIKPLDWKRVLLAAQRRDRAEFERCQQAWLAEGLRQAEAGLEKMGLPANSWRALHLSFDPDPENQFQRINVGIQSGPIRRALADGRWEVGEWPGRDLYAFVSAAPASDEAWEAMRLASMASALDLAMRTDWPSARFTLGRFVARAELAAPDVRQQIMRQVCSRAGHKAVQQYMRGAELLHLRIREDAERLRRRGRSIRSTAQILAGSAKLARVAKEQGTRMLTASGIRALLSPKRRKEGPIGR